MPGKRPGKLDAGIMGPPHTQVFYFTDATSMDGSAGTPSLSYKWGSAFTIRFSDLLDRGADGRPAPERSD